MSKTPRRPNYDRKLAHLITLADGRSLTTLKHTADLLTEVFAPVNAQWGALDHAIRLLIEAPVQARG